MSVSTTQVWRGGGTLCLSVNVMFTHRVPPHGSSHRSHCSGVSRHLSEAFVRDGLSELHLLLKYVQHTAGKPIYKVRQRREWENGGKTTRLSFKLLHSDSVSNAQKKKNYICSDVAHCVNFLILLSTSSGLDGKHLPKKKQQKTTINWQLACQQL